jgi:glycosyltransferase involved in cell wall biosynthesis
MRNSSRVIDLTGKDVLVSLRVAMVTRFPPSISGAAQAASSLASALARYGVTVEVIRLVQPGEASASGRPVVMDLNPSWRLGGRVAAIRANRSDVIVVELEHEPPVSFIEELMDRATVPVLLTLDEIPSSGTPLARAVAALTKNAFTVVVPSTRARERLREQTAGAIHAEVIPHGSDWSALEPPRRLRRRILTWGFLSPGVGAERVIGALALLDDIDPAPQYRVIGVCHPAWPPDEVARYRDELRQAAEALGVGESVEFGPVLHSRQELLDEVESSDVVAVMYDAADRTTSRIITEAVSAARPVVATRFPGAVELLDGGAGVTVAHDDTVELAAALRRLLTDDEAYLQAATAARSLSATLGWDSVASRFVNLLVQVASRSEAVDSHASV